MGLNLINSSYSYKRRRRLGLGRIPKFWVICVIILTVFCCMVHTWRITQKCPHGHYYNDGCTACWCDIRTGQTKCERLMQCSQTKDLGNCPLGRQYKDRCGNDCSCYQSTGAVFCNEKRKCPPEPSVTSTISPIRVTRGTISPLPGPGPILNRNQFNYQAGTPVKRFSVPIPAVEKSDRFGLPQITSTYPPYFSEISTRSSIFDNAAVVSSTPRSQQLHLPGSRSAELIIEPAIIVRKKGSNKASVIRNPSSATEVTLSSRNRNRDANHHPTSIMFSKSDNDNYVSSYQKPSSSLAPLNLYAKQMKTIMDIRKAYSQLLRSKVNFNFQIATGKDPTVTLQNNVTPTVSSSKFKLPFNSLVVFQKKNDQQNVFNGGDGSSYQQFSSTDHPRRFDENYENSTFFVDSPSTTTMRPPILQTKPLFWRHKEHIKNALKNLSPVPPLRQLVSYVSTSTESYLSNLLNRNKPQQLEIVPLPPDPTPPPHRFHQHNPHPTYSPMVTSYPPSHEPQVPVDSNSILPSPLYPAQSFSTIEPYHDLQQYHQDSLPIHEVYQNHDMSLLSSTPAPNYYSNNQNSFSQKSYIANHFDKIANAGYDNMHGHDQDPSSQFPFMKELMHEIARSDHFPTAAPPTASPALTAVPTFQTPGPPYAEIDVVQPLSFLPPPQPEPATPTQRTLMVGSGTRHPLPVFLPHPNRARPTVRVNLDKPIYVNTPKTQQFKFPYIPYQQPQQVNHQPPAQPQRNPIQTYLHPMPPPPNRRFHTQQSIITKHLIHKFPNAIRRNHQQYHPQHHHHQYQQPSYSYQAPPQYFIPKPKHYRVVLKGPKIKEAAVKVDDVVPRFVSRIAQEFFKKPEIYIPKIRPGKPLTLEKVVLNHEAMVPKEIMWSSTPGTPPAKLRFTPQAHWKMREDLGKHGIMFNTPIHSSPQDYLPTDPNVMEMDAPVTAIKTWETHTGVGVGTYTPGYPSSGDTVVQANQGYSYYPILPSSTTTPAPTLPPLSLDHQIQQEIQQQILLTQQQEQQKQQLLHQYQNEAASTSGFSNDNNAFAIDPNDFNDFNEHHVSSGDVLPPQLNIPGVKQVVVDKFMVHDPLNPSANVQVFSTTTVDPPIDQTTPSNVNVDLSSILTQYNTHRHGAPAFSLSPTPPPAVLIRHHGAPSPTPASATPTPTTPQPYPTIVPGNLLFSWVQSTPKPLTFTSTMSPNPTELTNAFRFSSSPFPTNHIVSSTEPANIANQIQDFLEEKMDFGANPNQMNFYDMLFNSRSGIAATSTMYNDTSFINDDSTRVMVDMPESFGEMHGQDQLPLASSSNSSEGNVETDRVASIFSIDYQHKFNREPPKVIIIKVPSNVSQEEPFPEFIEKRLGEEIEIRRHHNVENNDEEEEDSGEVSPNTTALRSQQRLPERRANSGELSSVSTSNRRKHRRKGNKGKRRRKKKRRNRHKKKGNQMDDEETDARVTENENNTSKEWGQSEISFKTANNKEAEQKFHAEIDWKSKLMANICDLNPSSPLCLTYRSICLLMTSSSEH